MAARRVSARGLSMSPAAKKLLKEKRRKEKLGISHDEKEPAGKGSWIVLTVIFAVLALLTAWVLSQGGLF